MEKLSASLSEITWSPLALPLDAVVSKFRLPTLVRLAHGKTRTFFSDLQHDPSNFSHAEDVAFVNRQRNRSALCHHSCVNQTSTSTHKMSEKLSNSSDFVATWLSKAIFYIN